MIRLPLLACLALVATLIGPFGRLGMAEAAAMPTHAMPMAMAGHCEDVPASEPGHPAKQIDCMIACAVVLAAASPELNRTAEPLDLPRPAAPEAFTGIRPEAEPPPPRRA